MMNSIAIRPEMAPKDGDFGFDVSRCEASLPAGTIDHSTQMVYNEVLTKNLYHCYFLISVNSTILKLIYQNIHSCQNGRRQ